MTIKKFEATQEPINDRQQRSTVNSSLRKSACQQAGCAFDLPLAMSINDTAATLGIGRTSVYLAIAQNRLMIRKLGRRTLVLTASITRLLEEASDVE